MFLFVAKKLYFYLLLYYIFFIFATIRLHLAKNIEMNFTVRYKFLSFIQVFSINYIIPNSNIYF